MPSYKRLLNTFCRVGVLAIQDVGILRSTTS